MKLSNYPNVIFIRTTESCNLKCVQCDYHKNTNIFKEGNLTLDEKIKLLNEIKKWNKDIRISLTGGEPFVRRDIFYALAEECKKIGLKASVTTNGTLIKEDELEKILDLDLEFILISIDSSEEDVHNNIRGDKNAFKLTTEFSRNIIKLRNQKKSNTKIYVSSLLGKNNLSKIPETVEFFKEIGFDGIFFQAIQPNFSCEYQENWIEGSPLYPTYNEAKRGIEEILQLKDKYDIISQTKEQFMDMLTYFKNPFNLPFKKCEAMNSLLIINEDGETQFCFDMDRLGKKTCGNVRKNTLQEIWNNNIEIRTKMSQCDYGCGLMNCHYKED